jgi:hypothetical protein
MLPQKLCGLEPLVPLRTIADDCAKRRLEFRDPGAGGLPQPTRDGQGTVPCLMPAVPGRNGNRLRKQRIDAALCVFYLGLPGEPDRKYVEHASSKARMRNGRRRFGEQRKGLLRQLGRNGAASSDQALNRRSIGRVPVIRLHFI